MAGVFAQLDRLAVWAGPVFYRLLFMSLTAALAGLVILLVERLFDRKLSPIWKYLLWGVVLAALLIPYRPQSSFSVVGRLEPVQEVSYRQEYEQARQKLYLAQQTEDPTAPLDALAHQAQRTRLRSALLDVALPLVWLAGAAGCAVWFAVSRLRLWNKLSRAQSAPPQVLALAAQCCREMGVSQPVPVLMQDAVNTPALTGVLRPRILLPGWAAEMPAGELRFVLLHELGHHRRRDLWLNELLLWLQCIYWFNPVIWVLFGHLRADMELLNDSFVLRKLRPEESRPYARSLVAVLGYSHRIRLGPRMLCMADGARTTRKKLFLGETEAGRCPPTLTSSASITKEVSFTAFRTSTARRLSKVACI